MPTRYISKFLASVAVALVSAALPCQDGSAQPQINSVTHKGSDDGTGSRPLGIGVIVPLTGVAAEYGTAIVNGINLAREEKPEKFQRCAFSIEDSAYKNTEALAAFSKLQSTGASVVYVFGGPMAEALAPVAERGKLPLIVDGIDPRVVAGRQFVVRYANTRRELGGAIARSLVKRGVKRAGIVVADNQYLASIEQGFAESSQGLFEVEVVARVLPEDSDLRYLAPKVRSRKFDAVGLLLFGHQAVSLAKNLHMPGAHLFSGGFVAGSTVMKDAQGALDGVIYPQNTVQEDFVRSYTKRFGNDHQIKFGAEGYDVATLLADHVCPHAEQGRLQGETVMQILAAVPPRRGAQGETVFKTTPEGDRYFSAPVVSLVTVWAPG